LGAGTGSFSGSNHCYLFLSGFDVETKEVAGAAFEEVAEPVVLA